jgi:hypothetical protein
VNCDLKVLRRKNVIGWILSGGGLWLYSQPLDAPKPFYWGGSLGIGGVHLWARPALAVRYHHTFFHFSPVPGYVSLGVSQGGIGYFRADERRDRPLYVAVHVHQRYWPRKDLRGDTRLMLLFGVRVWLEPYLQRFYLQAGIGGQVHWARPHPARILPTGEIQLGGFHRPHKYTPKRLRREGLEQW